MTTPASQLTSSGRLCLLSLAVSALFVCGCNADVRPRQGGEAAVPQPRLLVPPAVSINELMVAWIDHSGHELWDVEPEGRAPKTEADWRAVERHATQLAASGTLTALGGTGQADAGWARSPLWKKYSQELTHAGLSALAAARSRNFEQLLKANGQLVDVCEGCHNEFKPAVPTEGKTHQPH
jgi:hypothetical protein